MQREKPREPGRRAGMQKYLITWTLALEPAQFAQMAGHPESFEHGLNYVKSITKGTGFQLYRIVTTEEMTRFSNKVPTSARPMGIALVDAPSLEEARVMVEKWVDGLSYGGGTVPIRNYLEYEIKLLVDLGGAE